ncbi:winged helix DNA-binding domain-containing protein [Actinomadura parmotrematis]|uniref:Winged helix DNA-binding domain-containing protein n=1 Tax=Actinomadura parmotrematis TaxID=2864039 RepID=A0ABS7FM39_9ACTN|nr:winged helix DNA-binding domain-containing protein [Actinomadura parmotrematis]MBW8481065.1 winged helix DNA-binding domain-containing protein [Actinomadura parmotrematis]
MRDIGAAERRARLARRHRLDAAGRTEDVLAIVRSLVVLHATDPASVYLSAAARGVTAPGAVGAALYDDRTLLRLLAMRRTMFVAPLELVPALQASCADDLAAVQRRTYARMIERGSELTGAESWLAEVEAETHDALLELGEATGAQLSAAVPRLRTRVDPAPGKPYSRPTNVTTWVLVVLGAAGHIVRGRPNGGWTSSQYRWAPVEKWLPGGVPRVPAARARADLVAAYLRAFGPASPADVKWWTGWTAARVAAALEPLDTAEVAMDGAPGLVLADDLGPVAPPAPAAALLPALDPTPMGWQERGWFLGPHREALFDRNGNVGPTVWWDGRVVGGWAQRPDGEVRVRLLEDAGAEAAAAIDAEAARIAAFCGDVRAVPRFRTPLERELSG